MTAFCDCGRGPTVTLTQCGQCGTLLPLARRKDDCRVSRSTDGCRAAQVFPHGDGWRVVLTYGGANVYQRDDSRLVAEQVAADWISSGTTGLRSVRPVQ